MRLLTPVLTVAHLTLYETRRRRIVTAAIICAAAFLAVYTAGLFFVHREQVRASTPFAQQQIVMAFLAVAGLYGVNFLSILFAVLLPVDTLSGEIDSGVMHTIASKPVRRADIVIGKWLGHAVVVTGYVLGLSLGVMLAMRVVVGPVAVRPLEALPLIILEILLLMTVSIAGGTRLSTVTNGVTALGFYGIAFIGGWIEQVGGFVGSHAARTVGIVASLISPADALWRLGSYRVQPDSLRNLGAAVFSTSSVPTTLMVWWAAAFMVATLIFAVRSFSTRQL
jgi:ABC-type transport system involved in multi-copper enzyme maturation permease subunit